MSQKFETVPETRPITRCIERTCDLCGTKARDPERGDWEGRTSYDVSRTYVTCEEGSAFPEGRHTEIKKFDICPTCFNEKLVPWMESQGAKATVKNGD